MTDLRTRMHGLWLPLVTPFRNGRLDENSLRRLTRHYATQSIDGFILGATSGEGMTLREAELERLVAIVRDEMAAGLRNVPIGLGLSGADTSRMKERLDATADWPIDFYLIASPYYVRPSQRGILAHFEALADHAAWPLALYNIPYRCAVGITNQSLLRLAEHPNIVGLKDCGASREQSIALLRDRPKGFGVLTGEDANYFEALGDGADGGILLSAHLETATFAAVYSEIKQGNHDAAEARWQEVAELTRLLFTEPSPAPAKYWLWRTGLIDSPEVRLPMVEVSSELAAALDREIARRVKVAA
ncbi:4-hydroxy-tetrahydrodipicolinate synthase family protein [Bradyrhizobium guangzhouense]|uniref:4-hydroxy-tetrahydrodipicolinate synthase n=1 Tax=Bradyrhizobium guangzhouense TaxID=1325095 RepID=A0AAE5X5P8_9BRAD|nr:4-hydroxy-tetrahydrodipicolinate synthase [Bradyrhizobium guangzhouense]QAU49085.1 4-hydroxy-tetrahydrodipicolinate synthase [Bradyrhizobium guangzhouense]RXH10270.1 4-hydroxy-tetrahydrodipicolinate synthase [Bradyrhizobium guangzhouense]